MNENKSYFEQLPNELIISLFNYFYADELVQIFFNLNYRLNKLIKSINYLSLFISKNNQYYLDNFHIFSSYLYTLIIDDYINIDLSLFTNIYRLILINPSDKLLGQLITYNFNNLEYLSINCLSPTARISHIYQMIFSNNFPKLKSYSNLGYELIRTIDKWKQSPILNILKLGYIELSIFKTILSICPNLSYLDLGIIITNELSSKVDPHSNLKQLILRTSYNCFSKNPDMSTFKDLCAYLPNLEKLNIHRNDNISIIKPSFIKYDWFSTIISIYFPVLRRFYCYFHIFHLKNATIQIGSQLKDILNKIKENFQHIHGNRYYARLIID